MICFWNVSRNIWPTKTAINNLSWNQNGLLDTVNVSQKQPCFENGFWLWLAGREPKSWWMDEPSEELRGEERPNKVHHYPLSSGSDHSGYFQMQSWHFCLSCHAFFIRLFMDVAFLRGPNPQTFPLPLPELWWVAHRHHDAFRWLLINPKSSYCYTQVLERQFNRFAHTLICDSSEQFIGKCTVTYILSTLLTDLNVFVFCFFIKVGPELVISLLFNIFKCVIKGPNTSGWNYKMY